MDIVEPDDIQVLICNPHTDTWMPLREWIRSGPGIRKTIQPIAARHGKSGEPLPLTMIPLAVQNDPESWYALRLGLAHDANWPNEYYSGKLDSVDVQEGTIVVMTKEEKRSITVADDTQLDWLDDSEFRPMQHRLKDEHFKPGADLILMTKRNGDKEIAFQVQLLASEG